MSYDFSQLSSLDFEELCCDLLQQQEGIRYELFKPGKDQGIDARYLNGKACTIVQCKHYLKSGFNKLLNVLSGEELKKIQKLSPSRYVVMTSVPLSASNKKEIQDALSPYVQSQSDILGQEDLNNLLGLHPQVEEKHFKLLLTSTNVLNRIFHNAIITQSEQLVERIRRKIPIYVQNESFKKAVDILGEYHFVIISGEPGVGKTTLAEMLLLKYVEKGFRPFEVRDVKEAYDIYRPDQNFFFIVMTS
jgi:ATP-dependent exoDNAse (exonuclease V) alpha subunit